MVVRSVADILGDKDSFRIVQPKLIGTSLVYSSGELPVPILGMHWIDTFVEVLEGAVRIKNWRTICTVVSVRRQ